MSRSIQNVFNANAARYFKQAYGKTPAQLVEKWSALDPEGFAMLDNDLKIVAVGIFENMERSVSNPATRMGWGMNAECRDLFRAHGCLSEQLDAELCEARGDGEGAEKWRRMVETMTTSDVATMTRQLIYVVTRALATIPVWGIVAKLTMTAKSAYVAYEDVMWDSSTGAYATSTRVDLGDDPDYSVRPTCITDAAMLRLRYQVETMTVEDRLLGAEICLSALQDATDQYGRNPQEILPQRILWQLLREISRKVSQDWMTMAASTDTYSTTAAGVYTTLNPNEWIQVLAQKVTNASTTIDGLLYEPAQFVYTTTAVWGLIKRLRRYNAGSPGPGPVEQPNMLYAATGDPGQTWDEMKVLRDPYFNTGKMVVGIEKFTHPEHEGQAPYAVGIYHIGDAVQMLYHPKTTILEMAAYNRVARKMFEPKAYVTITVS